MAGKGLCSLLAAGALFLLAYGCVPGPGEEAPEGTGRPVEQVPSREGSQAADQPPYLPPAQPPQYVPPEKTPVYVPPGREPVYIPRPEGEGADQPPERTRSQEEGGR